jgi:hypothetical protein
VRAVEVFKEYLDEMEHLDRRYPHHPNPRGRPGVIPDMPNGRGWDNFRRRRGTEMKLLRAKMRAAMGDMHLSRNDKDYANLWHDRELKQCLCASCQEWRRRYGSS